MSNKETTVDDQSGYTVRQTAAYYALRIENIRDKARANEWKLDLRSVISFDSIQAFLDRIARDDLGIFKPEEQTPTDVPTSGCVFCGKPREFVDGGEWAGFRCADTKCTGWVSQHLPDDVGAE